MTEIQLAYGIGVPQVQVLPPPQFFQNTPNGTNWAVGQIGFTGTSGAYVFYIYSGAGVWDILDSAAGDILQITTQDSTVVLPSNGNINLSGSGSTTTVGSGSTATVELTGLTNHAVLVGAGTTTITKLAVGTTGQVLTGSTGNDPAFAALGTNSGLTVHGVLLGENNSAIAATAAGTNGQVLLGSTGADPAFGTITTTTGIAFGAGAASLSIDVKNGGYAVVDQTSGSATLAKQTSYVTDNGASLVTYTLPLAANAAQGNVYQVTGGSSGGWTIAQNASQTIHMGTQNTTTGVGGSISSSTRYASLTLQCINATGLDFVVIASSGTFTIV